MTIYIVYEANLWLITVSQDFTLGTFLLGAIKSTKNANPDTNKYSGYGIGLFANGSFLL